MRALLFLVLLTSCGEFINPVDGLYTFTDCSGRVVTFEVVDEELLDPSDEICESSEIITLEVRSAVVELEVECIEETIIIDEDGDGEPPLSERGTFFTFEVFHGNVPIEGMDGTATVSQELRHEIFVGTPIVPDDAELECMPSVRYTPPE